MSRPAEVDAPLLVIDQLFQQAQQSSRQSGASLPTTWGEREHFIRTLGLEDEASYAKIPCINDVEFIDNLAPNSLVRFRGMVQDVFEPEFYRAYVEEYSNDSKGASRILTTKYRECITPTAGCTLRDIGREAMGRRGAGYCVPVPGETPWARAASMEWARRGGGLPVNTAPQTPPPSVTSCKRSRPGEDVDMTPCEIRRPRATTNTSVVSGGAHADTAGGRMLRTAEDFGLNFPLPWEEKRGSAASLPCIVKLYDENIEALRVCETIEVVGILCVDPEIASFDSQPMEETFGRDARQPSTALVPRVHVLFIRCLPFYHPLLPFSPNWLTEARLASEFERRFNSPGLLDAARGAALEQLTRGLYGDSLAAEYLLLMLVSRAFHSYGGEMLGTWSLNLSRWTYGFAVSGLVAATSALTPRVAHLTLNGETLNTMAWVPTKDFVANRLITSQLQLAPGTLLLVDETQMSECQLSAQGRKAFVAISKLVTERELICDYQYDVALPLELQCVVVSAGRSIVKEVNVTLPLQPPLQATSGTEDLLVPARFLLGVLTRNLRPLHVPDEVAEQFSQDFAAVRQDFKEVQPKLCSTWLSLARASCLLHGEATLTAARWRSVLAFERSRLQRCSEACGAAA